MVYLAELFYSVFCIAFAYLNFKWITKGKSIDHFLNGAIHLAAWALALILTHEWKLLFVLPFLGKSFFDGALNYFRGLPQNYVTTNTERRSKLDALELKLFGNPLTARIIYLSFVMSNNIYYVAIK